MAKRAKVIESIRNNPVGVRFSDACRVAEWLGFEAKGGRGSHRTFVGPDPKDFLTFQDRKGEITVYQAKQLLVMVDKYYDEDDDTDE